MDWSILWRWIADIPNWVPAITSVVATIVAVLAYRRAGPPVVPKAWIEVKSRGTEGAGCVLHVHNNTDWQVLVEALTPRDEKIEIGLRREVKSPLKPWVQSKEPLPDPDYDYQRSLRFEEAVVPGGSFSSKMIAMRLPNSELRVSPVMDLSISIMRSTVRKKRIPLQTIILPATPRQT